MAGATPTWPGFESRHAGDIIRAIPALWIAALTIKLLVWLFARDQVLLDRAASLAIIVLAVVSVYRLTRLARSGLLWGVSRKLVVSYMLVGAVPILLLVTFAGLALLLVFFDVSSYLVHSRIAELTDRATTFARTTLFEIDAVEESRHQSIADRREAAIATRYPGVEIAVVPVDALPPWARAEGFSGLVADGRTARAAVLSPPRSARRFAVVVDLPVATALATDELPAAGIALGAARQPSSFNTATYITHVEWNTGETRQSPMAMSVDVATLYRWLAESSSRQPRSSLSSSGAFSPNFNRILLYMLVSIGVLLLVIEVVALTNGLALARTITTSVDELFHGTERIRGGDFGNRIPVRSDDQLGQLAASFNDMTARIRSLLLEQDEKRRLEQELRIARDIQMSLLPHGALKAPGISIAALCAPAREVGGDYYDFLPLSDGRVALLIADVSGKGTSAALYMAELKGIMLSLSRVHSSPRALLIEANRIISPHLDSRSFITMTYVVVDPFAKTLTCSRAGHTPFVRIAQNGAGATRAEVLVPDGMVLGLNLDGGSRFEQCLEELTMPTTSGDLFFFFTDGISDAMNREGAFFGETRLVTFLEAHAGRAPEEVRDRLFAEVAAFVQDEPQHDDITMVVLKIE